jgi:hypothetical protein
VTSPAGRIQDLRALRLEEAKKAFQEYQAIYPNGESVDDKLKLSIFLLGIGNPLDTQDPSSDTPTVKKEVLINFFLDNAKRLSLWNHRGNILIVLTLFLFIKQQSQKE